MSTYGSELAWFNHEMAKKLEENVHKQHWQHQTLKGLRRRLTQELKELDKELGKPKLNIQAVIEEVADVANFCMMIADHTNTSGYSADSDGCLIIPERHL